MPTSLGTAISNKTAEGVVEGVELAAPIAREYVKEGAKSWLDSKAVKRGSFITSGVVVALVYGLMARARRLARMEKSWTWWSTR